MNGVLNRIAYDFHYGLHFFRLWFLRFNLIVCFESYVTEFVRK